MEGQPPRFFAAVHDIFFGAKISAAAKRVNLNMEMVSDADKILEASAGSPSVVIIDLNDAAIHPIELIRKLKAAGQDPAVQIIGFVSHVQSETIREAQKAGCDLVLARSVFSQQLDDLLKQRSCHL